MPKSQNDNFKIEKGAHIDDRYLNASNTVYADTAAVLAAIPLSRRYDGLTVKTALGEYWFDGGIQAIDLKPKTGGASAFVDLTDVPSDFTGKGNNLIGVAESEDQIQYILPARGIQVSDGVIKDFIGKKTVGLTEYIIDADTDNGYLIFYDNPLGCTVTIPDGLPDDFYFGSVRAVGGGLIDHVGSNLNIINGITTIEDDTSVIAWLHMGADQFYGFGGSGAAGYTNEDAQDAVGSIMIPGSGINIQYNDSIPFISVGLGDLNENLSMNADGFSFNITNVGFFSIDSEVVANKQSILGVSPDIIEFNFYQDGNVRADMRIREEGILFETFGGSINFVTPKGSFIVPDGADDAILDSENRVLITSDLLVQVENTDPTATNGGFLIDEFSMSMYERFLSVANFSAAPAGFATIEQGIYFNTTAQDYIIKNTDLSDYQLTRPKIKFISDAIVTLEEEDRGALLVCVNTVPTTFNLGDLSHEYVVGVTRAASSDTASFIASGGTAIDGDEDTLANAKDSGILVYDKTNLTWHLIGKFE